jgi:hypothetical protein
VTLLATIIPNVLKFIINSAGLRPGLHLHKAAIDRYNITQMVVQIDPAQGYAQLAALNPITGAARRITKSMIFVDTIDEYISISTYLGNGLCSSMADYCRIVCRPFHASQGINLQE